MKKLFAVLVFLLLAGCAVAGPKYDLVAPGDVLALCKYGPLIRDGYNLKGTDADRFEMVIIRDQDGNKLVTLFFTDGEITSAIIHVAGDKKVDKETLLKMYPDACALLNRSV